MLYVDFVVYGLGWFVYVDECNVVVFFVEGQEYLVFGMGCYCYVQYVFVLGS